MNRDLPVCRDTAFLETCIPIDNASEIEVPNIFSPNGDGINDFFQVKAQTLRTFSGIIVNRWGRTVFEWENWQDYEAGWDGKLSGGTEASPGVYYFVINAVGMDDQEYEIQGPLHLMRN
jgi:gliding motility-associated-like protein